MFEFLNDKEFWSTVVNSSANIFMAGGMIVQTILFFITFKYGLQYLDQHKRKVKIEKNVELSQKIIYNLHRLNTIGESIFENINFLTARDLINTNQNSDIPNEFKDCHAKLTLISNNFEQKSFEISSIISETYMDSTERKNHIRKKRIEFKGFVPLSFHDLNFNEIMVFQKDFENLRNHLLSNHIP